MDEHVDENVAEQPSALKVTRSTKELRISQERFLQILFKIENEPRVNLDYKDWSRDPSYTEFKMPYPLLCRERYKEHWKQYERQFQHEIEELVKYHASAYGALRFQRHVAICSLWPPLHTNLEMENTRRTFFTMGPKDRARLNVIMSTDYK